MIWKLSRFGKFYCMNPSLAFLAIASNDHGPLGGGRVRVTAVPALVFWSCLALSAAGTVLVPEDAAAAAARGHRASGCSLVAHLSREDIELDSAARADQATDHRTNDRENIRCCHRRVPNEQCRRRCQ